MCSYISRYETIVCSYVGSIKPQVCYLVFEVSSRERFETLQKCFYHIQQHVPKDCVYVVIGTKLDLGHVDSKISKDAREWACGIRAVYGEISNKTQTNVHLLFPLTLRLLNLNLNASVSSLSNFKCTLILIGFFCERFTVC